MAQRIYLLHAVTPFALGLALGLAACGESADTADTAAVEEHEMDAAEMAAPAPASAPDAAALPRTAAPAGASISFGNLTDGQVVSSPVTVEFVATGVDISPAADRVAGAGHHHLLIDTTVDALDVTAPIPTDDNHRHFGMAQTSADIELAPGTHTLQMVLGDWSHIPFDPVIASPVITVTVE